jgi:hypothetical protein
MFEPTLLCITSFEKGADFMRQAKADGARVLLLTVESLLEADWPSDVIDGLFAMPNLYNRESVYNAVSYLARMEKITRIVPLDEFDVEMAGALREHLRLPGMSESGTRFFRDKLAMRIKARDAGIRVPAFTRTLPYGDVHAFLDAVPPPWVLKPRMEASAVGIKMLDDADMIWRTFDALGDAQSHYLIEQFIAGDVYHVDSIVVDGRVVFCEKHRYHKPPFEVYHGGGLFRTSTIERASADDRELEELTQKLSHALGMTSGILHTEFIRASTDGQFHFLETAARVGGAYIAEMVEASTGVNLWREWARLEMAEARGQHYEVVREREHYGAVILSLARQQWPDTSAFRDPEIVYRVPKEYHAGFVLQSPSHHRILELLDTYGEAFMYEFAASMPAKESLR